MDILRSLLRLAEQREAVAAREVENATAAPRKLVEAKVDRLNAQIALQREQSE